MNWNSKFGSTRSSNYEMVGVSIKFVPNSSLHFLIITCTCSISSRGDYLRAASISFRTCSGAATIRELLRVASGITYSMTKWPIVLVCKVRGSIPTGALFFPFLSHCSLA